MRQGIVELQCSEDVLPCFGDRVLRWQFTRGPVIIGQARVGWGVVWIRADGLLEIFPCHSTFLQATSIPVVASLEVGLMRARVHRMIASQARLLLRSECQIDPLHYRAGDVGLQGK